MTRPNHDGRRRIRAGTAALWAAAFVGAGAFAADAIAQRRFSVQQWYRTHELFDTDDPTYRPGDDEETDADWLVDDYREDVPGNDGFLIPDSYGRAVDQREAAYRRRQEAQEQEEAEAESDEDEPWRTGWYDTSDREAPRSGPSDDAADWYSSDWQKGDTEFSRWYDEWRHGENENGGDDGEEG